MAKRKKLINVFLILVSVVLLTAYWANQHKILSGDYDKLTVSGMEGTTILVINDRDEIGKIISAINESPRTFKYDNGFTYDYLPQGILTFENEKEKVQIGFIFTTGNTVTKYWEIHTDFPYRQ
ncbi:hypothetical protein [Bacillus sp. ISL-55]|uniref:hypothetical protein n=1 Tax=Bacillus sp. ISL-55 TaxID=2819134 RepID=UPI001BEC9360|nr:hypothetical protein [Bacillus sp. ISL-55]MBT2694861.1 hypothetical protein [Bacillus sp. ISL-55]